MKRKLLIAVAFLATMTAAAQNIAAVSPNNATTIYQTLDDAIDGAESGSTIYLPGGGFQISDETKINKKLTIMGVSHRGDTDNVDGATIISGNLHFEEGSSGSAILGIYVSGDINVGTENAPVTNFTVRYCNVNSIQVKNSQSSGMIVNQSYLRNNSNFHGCNAKITNNILHSLQGINGGTINHNIITNAGSGVYYPAPRMTYFFGIAHISSSSIINNFILHQDIDSQSTISNCQISNNCIGKYNWTSNENPIILDADKTWDDVFGEGNNKGVSILSDYRLKGTWGKGAATDGSDIGIYGGTGFIDESLAPIPRIISKKVSESTDASGKLQIVVKVKAQ